MNQETISHASLTNGLPSSTLEQNRVNTLQPFMHAPPSIKMDVGILLINKFALYYYTHSTKIGTGKICTRRIRIF